MSTSIAVQPAYVATTTRRSQAKPDRTIFGTTLDNYKKCWQLLHSPQALQEADDLHQAKLYHKLGQRGSPTYRGVVQKAWGQRTNKYPEINRGLKEKDPRELTTFPTEEVEENQKPSLRDVASRSGVRSPSCFAKNRAVRNKAKSAVLNRTTIRPTPPRLLSAQPSNQVSRPNTDKPMSGVQGQNKRPQGGSGKVSVPKFRVPPNAARLFRTASLKITETGAKDLIHSREVNKIGLGDTLQYNHEAHKQREFPEFYKSHGDVRLLGQHFRGDTTNSDITAPGGYLRLSTADRQINERLRDRIDSAEEEAESRRPYRIRHPWEEHLVETRDSGVSADSEITEDKIPLNIRHKFGTENILTLLKDNKDEVKAALRSNSELKHSGIVPARKEVKELNHPIDPPPAYFDTFGKHLKYDQLEGGLHLYIK
uniref:Uncharacterized protein LOC100184747 n=1 Tax=Phallusia mammillata TaxID=59560 RepID=A0A6F9DI64_9ASCI|nr:uncharacterized protein LOC100184747 [Phallusia mammillata]